MIPVIHVNFPAILAATVASFFFGWLWHGPLFGRKWAALTGIKMEADCKPDPKMMMRGMGLTLVGCFLTAYVLLYSSEIWRASVWGVGADSPAYVYGLSTAFWVWLGFKVPMLLNTVAWESRSWSLYGLNVSFQFFNLLIISMILAYWR